MTQAVDGDPGSDTNSVQRLRGHDRAPAQNKNCTKHEDCIYNAQEIGVKKQRTPPPPPHFQSEVFLPRALSGEGSKPFGKANFPANGGSLCIAVFITSCK